MRPNNKLECLLFFLFYEDWTINYFFIQVNILILFFKFSEETAYNVILFQYIFFVKWNHQCDGNNVF